MRVTRPEDIDLERIAEANRIEIVHDDIDGATASVRACRPPPPKRRNPPEQEAGFYRSGGRI
jgi:hypothetical protein